MITDDFVDVSDMDRQDLEDYPESLQERIEEKDDEIESLKNDLSYYKRNDLSYYKRIEGGLDNIQKRKLSVTFNGGLWSVYDEKGEIASSNSLIDAIKKV